ncbi:MAG: hypothetical protein LC437_02285 [Thiohalomonas sp.]|nr:hypothetical protein [Thiohalomonas sp.]
MNYMSGYKQSGAVLFVSLVMLLLMTIIGITSMRSTLLEEKMAGNMINRGVAFQAAESALRGGEAYLKNTTVLPVFQKPTVSGSGLYLPTITLPQRWDLVDWADNTKNIFYVGTLTKVAAAPRYIIEKLPAVSESGGSLEVGVAGQVRYYRVTSRGVGGTDKAVVMLQTTYKR